MIVLDDQTKDNLLTAENVELITNRVREVLALANVEDFAYFTFASQAELDEAEQAEDAA